MAEPKREQIQNKIEWMVRRGKVLQAVVIEMERQDRERGENRHLHDGEWFKYIIEELGEASRGCQEGDIANAVEELIQAAALCIQAASAIEDVE